MIFDLLIAITGPMGMIFLGLWVLLFILICVFSFRRGYYHFAFRSHTITVSLSARSAILYVDDVFKDELGGRLTVITLKTTVDDAEIRVCVRKRWFAPRIEAYANGELLPLVGKGK